MVVWAKVCELTEDLLWFVCGNFDVFPSFFFFFLFHYLSYMKSSSDSIVGDVDDNSFYTLMTIK